MLWAYRLWEVKPGKSFLDLVGLGDLGCIDPTEGDSTVELGLPLGGDGAE